MVVQCKVEHAGACVTTATTLHG